MKTIKTLPKELCFKLISEQEDLIRREKERNDSFFKGVVCKCGGQVNQIPLFITVEENGELKKKPVFDAVLPKYIAQCIKCKSEFDPYTGMVYKC